MTPEARLLALRALFVPLALLLALAPRAVAARQGSAPAPMGDTVTTASGLRYVFLQHGDGPKPDSGDLMVIHGVGRFPDGKVFWDTREEGAPYEYTYLVDRVIAGFSEGMGFVRQGDRILIVMKPELAYGSRDRAGIPPNSTLVFDYEILGVYASSIPGMLRDGFATDGVDATLARLGATAHLWSHYASESDLMAAAQSAGRANEADRAKVLEFALKLVPLSYRIHQALARDKMAAGAGAEAIVHFQAAAQYNPRADERELRDYAAALKALGELKGG
jgi:hypothetical protein